MKPDLHQQQNLNGGAKHSTKALNMFQLGDTLKFMLHNTRKENE